MNFQGTLPQAHVREDGFGVRRIEWDGETERVEVLDLSSLLSTPKAEQAIRARAIRFGHIDQDVLAQVLSIGRVGDALSISSAVPEGVTLADLLAAAEFGTVTLADEALVELAAITIRAVALLHDAAGAPAHAALSPAHVIVRHDGSVTLSGALFADALHSLHYNREQLWREFAIAMPPSASLPRFDQRADVAQLGALVLAMLKRRMLTATEYPRGVHELVDETAATFAANPACAAGLRAWLQHALQLHPKAMFTSASAASRHFSELTAAMSGRRAGAQALQAAVRQLCGGREKPAAPSPPAPLPPAKREPLKRVASPPPPPPPAPPPRTFGFLRNVFPALRAN